MGKTATITSNTKFHVTTPRTCAVIECRVEADLVRIGSTYHGKTIEFFICQKHIGG